MKRTMRGAKRFGVMMLAAILVMESVSMPVRGEVDKSAKVQKEIVGEQISDNSVKKYAEETVSANFVSEEETEVSANTVAKDGDVVSSETATGEYSGTDGALEWSIDSGGHLIVVGEGDFEETPDWLTYRSNIKSAYVSVKNITTMKGFFQNCECLENIRFVNIDTSQVTDMSNMFYGCENLVNVWVNEIDTTKVTLMTGIFSGCKSLESVDLSKWNTEQVIAMADMFNGCENITELDLSIFDFSKLKNTDGMFYNCSKLEKLDMGKAEMPELTYTKEMFYNCAELEEIDVSKMDTKNVTNMEGMFQGCQKVKELDVSGFDTAKVLYMKNMFADCGSVKELDVSGFDTAKVKDMSCMFQGCKLVEELDISEFATSSVTDMRGMFLECASLQKIDLSSFDTSAVTVMAGMFSGCESLKKLDVSHFDMSKVYITDAMFKNCTQLTELNFGKNQDLNKVITMISMFEGCRSMKKIEMETMDTIKVKNANFMFKDCSGLTTLEGIGISVDSLQTVQGMFQGCSSLEEIDEAPFYNAYITDMSYMFKGCISLKHADMSFIMASNLTTMSEACTGCSSLTKVTFPKGTPSSLENMSRMFSGCKSIESIDLSEFKASSVNNISSMFSDCANLKEVNLYGIQGKKVTSLYRVFAGCKSLQYVDLTNMKVPDNVFIREMFENCTGLIEISITPAIMKGMIETKFTNFEGCDLFSDIYFDGTVSQWTTLKPTWENCTERKLKYAAIHLSDGTVEQELHHEGSFRYIKQGGFDISDEEMKNPESYVYNCDLSQLFENSYNYSHNLAQMSIRVAMAAMSDDSNINSNNIGALMNDLNVTHRKVSYPKPQYDSIGYAIGTRRIYHNNQKKTLIMVAIRGGGYGAEWGGNANVGAGVNHAGFDIAANQVYVGLNEYLGELKECGYIEEDAQDIVVWISGYSRGAATANLLAAKLNDNYNISAIMPKNHLTGIQSKNVFAFCFECPRNTTNANYDNVRYNNICNIINPKDFVVYVAMNNGVDWRFRRYGRDLMIPDEANTKGSDYSGYFANMKAVYQADELPRIGAYQSVLVKDVARRLANIIERVFYPTVYQEKLQIILAKTFPRDFNLRKVLYELGSWEILKLDVVSNELILLSTDIEIINVGIMYAHYPELCLAWMDSLSEEVLTKQKSFWNVFVNCPVDIYVYEKEKLVGCIKNDTPQEIANGVITMLDNNGQKKIVLPGDGDYRMVYKATGDGTMTVSTSKYIQAESIPEKIAGYYELPLKAGSTYEAKVSEDEFKLLNAKGTVMNPSVVQTGAAVQFYKVDISAEGNGEVSGINTYSVGEFAKVSAYPAEGEKFLGWYRNGKLISKDKEYRFCVKENTTLVAKFTDKRVKVGNKYKIKKHTYKITNVKKRTVSFVKTSSKSKTIKIPSTVKINGKKYKVTAIATSALKGNKKVTKVIIGSNVTKIGKKAFYNCKRLKNITIKSKKLKSVGKYAFKGIAKYAAIKCPGKKMKKKYKKMIKKSKVKNTVRFK